jgi:hypothetical protein
VEPAVQGKYYVVQPEVINSTGHPQLGGNYLTLRVFYWLKAAIVDALLSGPEQDPGRSDLLLAARQELELQSSDLIPPLVPWVVNGGIEVPVPEKVAPVLRRLLPTHWDMDAPSESRQAFRLLWDIAEAAKIKLGDGGNGDGSHYLVSLDSIAPALNAIKVVAAGSRDLQPLLPKEGIRLHQEDFQTLARPVIAQAAELAGWLVRCSLGRTDGQPPQRLDRVMLSGKTSMMELTRHVIAEQLGGGGGAGDSVPWNPAAISVESQYAKQAASLGAAWAHATGVRLPDQDGVKDQLRIGRSVLAINVDNVFHSLPCEFRLMRPQDQTSTLLAAGTPLLEVDQDGRLAARREWTDEDPWPALVPAFEVHRPIRQNKTQTWGTYHFQREAERERGFTLDRRIWYTSPTGDSGARVRAQVEIDQRLVPMLHLSQGRPHYLTGKLPGYDIHTDLPAQAWNEHESLLRMLPSSVVIAGSADEGHPDGERELFPPWLPESDSLLSAYFPDYFHDHAGLDSEAVPGRISGPMPLPAPDGQYRLLLRRPGERDRELTTFQVLGRGEPTVRYVATLDVRGQLTLHRGYPSFWPAYTLRDVQSHQGSVLRCKMGPGRNDPDPNWEPFNGRH